MKTLVMLEVNVHVHEPEKVVCWWGNLGLSSHLTKLPLLLQTWNILSSLLGLGGKY